MLNKVCDETLTPFFSVYSKCMIEYYNTQAAIYIYIYIHTHTHTHRRLSINQLPVYIIYVLSWLSIIYGYDDGIWVLQMSFRGATLRTDSCRTSKPGAAAA